MSNIYRVRHIDTGLFYRPSTEAVVRVTLQDGNEWSRYVKTNLSKTAKLYQQRPSVAMLSGSFYNHVSCQRTVQHKCDADSKYNPYFEAFWWSWRHLQAMVDQFELQQLVDGQWQTLGLLT